MFEATVAVHEDDLSLFKAPTTSPEDLQDHLAYMPSDARRKAEVSLSNLTPEERTMMEQAKDKEVDQWSRAPS